MAKQRFTTRKYEGDDRYSWAVFDARDVKGLKGVVFSFQARPVTCGHSRDQARRIAKRLTENGGK